MTLDALLTKLDIGKAGKAGLFKIIKFLDDSIFDREAFMTELGKTASRDELIEFIDKLKRSCAVLRTERISFINDKYPEVLEAIQILSQVN